MNNEHGAVFCEIDGWAIKQRYNKKSKRFYCALPKRSGLRERYGNREVVLRSHLSVFLRDGIDKIPYGYVVHHIDRDRLNDLPDNLQVMTASDHDQLHREDGTFVSKNFKGEKHKESTIKKMRKNAIKRGNNGIWEGPEKTHTEETKKLMSSKASGKNNATYRHDLSEKEVIEYYKECGNISRTAAHFGCSNTAIRNRVKGVVPEKKIPNSKKIKSSKELVCYAALNGIEKASQRYDITEEEVIAKIINYRGRD